MNRKKLLLAAFLITNVFLNFDSFAQDNKCPDFPAPEKYATHITWHGSKYVGQVRNGKPNGMGHLVINSNSQYYGNWLDGLKHGHGIECTDSGAKSYRRAAHSS